jgi:hypothetical protein
MTGIRTVLAILAIGALASMALVQAENGDDAAVLLEAAIQTELVDGDLNAAIKQYSEIVQRFGAKRNVAARALLYLGRTYDKLGQPAARKCHERVLAELTRCHALRNESFRAA